MASIEFFHNVVCSFCFIQSARLRKLFKEQPDLEIRHRSFPLRYQKEQEKFPFKMYDEEKGDILKHWERANQIDEAHRFNIEGMKKKDFEFPSSRLAELAIKAAVLTEGEKFHWDMFDCFQEALFVRNLNIANDDVVRSLIKETGIDYESWTKHYENPKTEEDLFEDYQKVEQYELNLIPALVLEKEKVIKGALRPELIRNKMNKFYEDK